MAPYQTRKYEMKLSTKAMGYCRLCGSTLKDEGIDVGMEAGDTICYACGDQITRVTLAREGRVSVLAQFKSDPFAYLTEHGFLDARGRVKPEHMPDNN